MRIFNRRSLLSGFGLAIPFGLGVRAVASSRPSAEAPALRFLSFEEAVREAFADAERDSDGETSNPTPVIPCRRVEVGPSDLVRTGLQGCHNDRPFAGYPTGHLRIISTGSQPGPIRQGVRLYVSTVDIALCCGSMQGVPGRPLDFASLPPAPTFC
jgi:hypothetical protein